MRTNTKFLIFFSVGLFLNSSFAGEKKIAPVKINIAYSQTVINAQIGLILEKTDILRKRGFDPSVVGMASGKELKTALVSGQADVILTSESNFVVVRGVQFEAYAISTLGSAGRLALVVKNDGKINKLEELKGKKIGALFGTTVHQRALEWKNKIDLSGGTQLVSLGSAAALAAALEAESIEATMMWDPFLEEALNSKKVKILGTSDFDLISLVSKSFIDKNPKGVGMINAAFLEAFFYLLKNKEEVNKWYSDVVSISPATLDAASKVNKNYSAKKREDVNIKITSAFKANLEKVSEFLLSEKVIPGKPEINSYIRD